MNAWIVVIAAGVGSYLFRVSMLVLAARFGLPPILERATRFAVPTAFAALAAGSLAAKASWSLDFVPPLAAVLVAVAAVRRTGSPHAAIAAGMPVLWLTSAAVSA